METIRKNKHTILESALLISIGVFPLLPEPLKGLPVAILLLFGVYQFTRTRKITKLNFTFIVLVSLLLINLLSVVYSGSFWLPTKKLETSLSFLLVPLGFHLLKDSGIHWHSFRRRIYLIFCYSTALLSGISMYFYWQKGLFAEESLRVNSFRQLITEIPWVGDHPIYVSIYLALALFFSMIVFKSVSKRTKMALVLFALLNVFNLLLLSSKGVIIGALIGIIYYSSTQIKSKWIKAIVALGIIGLFVLAVMKFPNLERRFREIGIKTTYTQLKTQNSSSIRLAVYKCALQKISEKPIVGYGWGKGNESLMTCYTETSETLEKGAFNSHNQYFGFLLDGGIPALLVLLFFVGYFLRMAWIKKDYELFLILLFYALLMLAENILVRQSGLILFMLLLCGFIHSQNPGMIKRPQEEVPKD